MLIGVGRVLPLRAVLPLLVLPLRVVPLQVVALVVLDQAAVLVVGVVVRVLVLLVVLVVEGAGKLTGKPPDHTAQGCTFYSTDDEDVRSRVLSISQ